MLFFPVLAATHPCLSDPNPPLCVLGALGGETPSCPSLSLFPRLSSLTCPARSDLVGNPLGKRLAVTYLESTLVEVLILNNFKPPRMNTYEKHRGRGRLQLSELGMPKNTSRIHFSFQPLPRCPSRNSFLLITIHFHGEGGSTRKFYELLFEL
jgi:hypothetical protein